SEIASNFHQASDTFLINRCKRICIHDIELGISGQETARIIPAHSECRLREIVRAKAEELGAPRALVRHERSARNFDHCPDEVFELCSSLLRNLGSDAADDLDLKL